MTDTNPRDLIRRLTEKLDHLHCYYNVPDQSALIAEARDYLDQSVPEKPTDREIIAAFKQATKDFPPTHPDAKGLDHLEYAIQIELRKARAVLAQPERQKLSDLRARVETLEAAAHRHIVETKANILALASRVNALELELAERRLSKVLDISDLPQLTPEQVQNLQDLLGTYRNHLGLNN
jgi:hypothetical protein